MAIPKVSVPLWFGCRCLRCHHCLLHTLISNYALQLHLLFIISIDCSKSSSKLHCINEILGRGKIYYEGDSVHTTQTRARAHKHAFTRNVYYRILLLNILLIDILFIGFTALSSIDFRTCLCISSLKAHTLGVKPVARVCVSGK